MTVIERTDTVAHFIGGEEVPSASGRTFASIDPSTGREIAQVAFGEAEDVDRAVAAGQAAFESGAWSKAAPGERAAVMRRLADLIHQDADRIGAIESRDTGKPLGQAIAEVNLGADFITYFAGHAELPDGTHLPGRRRLLRLLQARAVRRRRRHQPWNYPFLLACWKTAPALAVGNSVVLKMAEQTPLSTAELGRLTLEAGMPAGVFNVVHGDGPTTGAALVAHPHVPKLTFTGSTVDGPGDPPLRRRPHQERPPRARRQDAEHRVRRRGPRPGDRGLAVHRVLQHGPDLHERVAPAGPAQRAPTRSSTRSWSAPRASASAIRPRRPRSSGRSSARSSTSA